MLGVTADDQCGMPSPAGGGASVTRVPTRTGWGWAQGKSSEILNPLGSWLVTSDEIDDVGSSSMWLEVNGERVQNGTTRSMVFDVPNLVWIPEPVHGARA
jgi:hypothetical protein